MTHSTSPWRMACAKSASSMPRNPPISRMYSMAQPCGRSAKLAINRVQVRSALHQRADYVAVPTECCVVQSRCAYLVALIDELRMTLGEGFERRADFRDWRLRLVARTRSLGLNPGVKAHSPLRILTRTRRGALPRCWFGSDKDPMFAELSRFESFARWSPHVEASLSGRTYKPVGSRDG